MLSQESKTTESKPCLSSVQNSPARETLVGNFPNLFILGAMKASTTTFYELITRHPEIWFAQEKEPHYFTSSNYGQPQEWQKYLRLFDEAPKSAKFLGEASTGYSKLPHFGNTPQRLRESLTYPRFIYLIRDPVQRTISNFRHSYLSGHYEPGTTLSEAVQKDPILIDASCYARQILAYQEVFGKASLLIIPTDQLHAQPAYVMRNVETFLHLPEHDGWKDSIPQSNSQQALGRNLKLQSFVPKPLFNTLKSVLPKPIRNQLKNVASSSIKLPEISDSDRQQVFDLIVDDLRELQTLVHDEQAAWLSDWPSIKQLGEGS